MLIGPLWHKCQLFRFFTNEKFPIHAGISFIVKTEFLFVDLSGKPISNNFSGVTMDFCFRKKSEQLTLMIMASFSSPASESLKMLRC